MQSVRKHCGGLLINITSLALQPFPPEVPQRKGPERRADDASPAAAQAAGARIGAAAALQESEEGRPTVAAVSVLWLLLLLSVDRCRRPSGPRR